MFSYKLGGSISYIFFQNFSHTVIFCPFFGPFRACKCPIEPEGSSKYMLKQSVEQKKTFYI